MVTVQVSADGDLETTGGRRGEDRLYESEANRFC